MDEEVSIGIEVAGADDAIRLVGKLSDVLGPEFAAAAKQGETAIVSYFDKLRGSAEGVALINRAIQALGGDLGQLQAAFDKAKNASSAFNDAMRSALGGIQANAANIEAAFQQLGVKSSASIEAARVKIENSMSAINAAFKQGLISAPDLAKATEGYKNKLGELAEQMKGTSAAQQQLGTVVGGVQQVLGQAGISTGFLSTALRMLVSPQAAVIAGFGAMAYAAKQGVDAMMANAEQVKNLMAVSGMTAEAADNLADTFEILGESTGTLNTALFLMSRQIEMGGEKITSLGISLRDASGQVKNAGELFLDVRNALGAMESATERNSKAQEIFGRSARSMSTILAMSNAEFAKYSALASDVSEWNQELQDTTMRYAMSKAYLDKQLEGMALRIGQHVIPALTSLNQWLSSLIDKAKSGIEFDVQLKQEVGGKTALQAGIENFYQWLKDNKPPPIQPELDEMAVVTMGKWIVNHFAQIGAQSGKAFRDNLAKDMAAAEMAQGGVVQGPVPLSKEDKGMAEAGLAARLAAVQEQIARENAMVAQGVAMRSRLEEEGVQVQIANVKRLAREQEIQHKARIDMMLVEQANLTSDEAKKAKGVEIARAMTAARADEQRALTQTIELNTRLLQIREKTAQLAAAPIFGPAWMRDMIAAGDNFESIDSKIAVLTHVLQDLKTAGVDPAADAFGILQAEINKLEVTKMPEIFGPGWMRDMIIAGENFDSLDGQVKVLAGTMQALRASGVDPTSEAFKILKDSLAAAQSLLKQYNDEVKSVTDSEIANAVAKEKLANADLLEEAALIRVQNALEAYGNSWNSIPFGSIESMIANVSSKLKAQQEIFEMLKRAGVDPASDAMKLFGAEIARLYEEFVKLQSIRIDESMEAIAVKARILGSDFDATSARVSVLRREFDALADASKGKWTPELEALGQKLRSAIADERLEQSMQRIFGSVTDTFGKMAEGLIQGTLNISDAFKNLGQSLLVNFAQMVIREVFDPILKAAASFMASLIRILMSGDWDSIGGAWGKFLSTAFSAFTSGAAGAAGGGGKWVEGSTGLMEWQEGPGGFSASQVSASTSAWKQVIQFGMEAIPLLGNIAMMIPSLSGIGSMMSGSGLIGAAKTAFTMGKTLASPGGPVPVYDVNAVEFYDFAKGGFAPSPWTSANIGSLVGGIGSLIGLIGHFTGSKALGYAGTGISAVGFGIGVIPKIPAIGGAISNIAVSAFDAITKGLSATWSVIGPQIMSALGSSATGFLSSLGSTAAGVVNTISTTFNTVNASLQAVGGVMGVVGAVVGTGMSIFQAVTAETDIDKAWASMKALGYASGLATFGIGTIVTGIVDAIDSIIQLLGGPALTELVMDVYDVSSGMDGVVALMSTVFSGGFDMLSQALFGFSIGGLLADLFGPSEAWKSFPERIEKNIDATGVAIENLWKGIDGATSPEAIQEQINQFIASIGAFAGGFGEGAEAFKIPVPPGATGTEHEGMIKVDYSAIIAALQKFVDSRLKFFREPLAWFEETVQTYFDAMQTAGITEGRIARPVFTKGVTGEGTPAGSFVEWGGVIFDLTNKTGQELKDMLQGFQEQVGRITAFDMAAEGIELLATALDVAIPEIDTFVEGTKTMFKGLLSGVVDLSFATGEQMKAYLETLKTQLGAAIAKDPIKILPLLDMKSFAREGETLEQTTERIGQGFMTLGSIMKSLDAEIAGLRQGGLAGATTAFNFAIRDINKGIADATEHFHRWALRWDESSGLIGDPGAMAEAATQIHDLAVQRYEAEMALIQAIDDAIGSLFEGANALVSTASRLADLGIKIPGMTQYAANLTERATASVGGFDTPGRNVIAGQGAVGLFASQSMMAAKAMDLEGMKSAMISAGNLVTGFTATIDGINKIEDPAERMRLLTEVLGQVGAATEAAAQAAIAYWTALHDTVQGMMDQIDAIASNISNAGRSVANNADWLKKAGVNIPGLAKDTLALIELFPTMASKLELLGAGIEMFVAGISEQTMTDLKNLGAQYTAAAPGSATQQNLGEQIKSAFQPVLTGIFNSFTAAMALQDPGQRLTALTNIMDTVGSLLGGLPPELADALIAMFGPEIQALVTAQREAATAAAAQAALVAAEMKTIIGDKALSPENFLLMTVAGIKDSMALIVQHAGPLFVKIAEGMEKAGVDIGTAINTAGVALSNALAGFKTPAEQLANALSNLGTTLGTALQNAVAGGIRQYFGDGHAKGIEAVPQTGIYMLHEGEGVLTKQQNDVLLRGGVIGSYAAGTMPYIRNDPRGGGGSMSPEAITILTNSLAKYESAARAAAAATDGATEEIIDYVGAIEGAVNAIADNAELLRYTAIDFGRLAKSMADLSMSIDHLETKTKFAIAGMKLWAADIARFDDVFGMLVGGGAIVLNTINSMVDAAFEMDDTDPAAKLNALTLTFNTVAQMASIAEDAVRKSFSRQREAIQDMNRAREEAIADEQDAIRDQIDALQELEQAAIDWKQIAEDVADTIFQLQQGEQAPPDAAMQLARAQMEFQAAMGRYRAGPSAETAQEVQSMGRAVLDAAAKMYTKPSPEYAALFDSIIAQLEEVRADAAGKVGTAVDYLAQITALEEESKALDEQRNALQDETNAQLRALDATEKQALDVIALAIAPTMDKLAVEMERVGILAAKEVQMQDSLGLLEQIERNTAAIANNTAGGGGGGGGGVGGTTPGPGGRPGVTLTPEQGKSQSLANLQSIQAGMAAGADIMPALNDLYSTLVAAGFVEAAGYVLGIRNAVQAGQVPDLSALANYVASLPGFEAHSGVIAGIQETIASRGLVPGMTPGPWTPPGSTNPDITGGWSAQGGDWRTHAGLYQLHAGEMVVPEPFAETLRNVLPLSGLATAGVASGLGSLDRMIGGNVSNATSSNNEINVTINGSNAQQIWGELRPLLDDYIRPGRRGGVIMRGQNRRKRGR